MRYSRQSKILEIIKHEEIDTQERLAQALSDAGFSVTQATVSRDIKEMGLVKRSGKNGRSFYTTSETKDFASEGFNNILTQVVLDIKAAENMIVIKTLSGCANAAAEVIDRISPDSVLGTIAGDNTIFMVVDSKDNVQDVVKIFNKAMI